LANKKRKKENIVDKIGKLKSNWICPYTSVHQYLTI